MADNKGKRRIFSRSVFAIPTKVSETLGVVLHISSKGLLVARLKTWLRKHFLWGAPIRNVQDVISNTGHSYYCAADNNKNVNMKKHKDNSRLPNLVCIYSVLQACIKSYQSVNQLLLCGAWCSFGLLRCI